MISLPLRRGVRALPRILFALAFGNNSVAVTRKAGQSAADAFNSMASLWGAGHQDLVLNKSHDEFTDEVAYTLLLRPHFDGR
jgi:hypothetical protein